MLWGPRPTSPGTVFGGDQERTDRRVSYTNRSRSLIMYAALLFLSLLARSPFFLVI